MLSRLKYFKSILKIKLMQPMNGRKAPSVCDKNIWNNTRHPFFTSFHETLQLNFIKKFTPTTLTAVINL